LLSTSFTRIAVGESDQFGLALFVVIDRPKMVFEVSINFETLCVLGDHESESPQCGMNFGLENAERIGDFPI